MTIITIDLDSPERAWSPFLDWMQGQGLVPTEVRSISIDPETMTAAVEMMKRDEAGKHYVEDGELAVEIKLDIQVSSLPPLRVSPPA